MKGISAVCKKSQGVICEDRSTWLPLFYSYVTDTVYTKPGEDRHLVTQLINPNKPEDIRRAVERWKRM